MPYNKAKYRNSSFSFCFQGFSVQSLRPDQPPANLTISTVFPNRSRRQLNNTENGSPCLKDAFKDILLVVVYNHPLYDSIPHLVALYKPAFPHLLFCGPPHNTTPPEVLTVDIIQGFLGYKCLGRAIREYPGYKGYFYISDDVILKYWKFPDFDREKIWESYKMISNPVNEPTSSNWYWWNTMYGLNNCRRACKDVAKMTFQEKKLNGIYLLNSLSKNSNGTIRCFRGRSDVIYIPRKHAKAFSILSETFYKQQVFLEIAVPTINRLLERNENIALLPGFYINGTDIGDPRVSDSRFFWLLYFWHNEFCFIHPFKLHRGGLDSKFNFAMLKFIFLDKIKAHMNCKPTRL